MIDFWIDLTKGFEIILCICLRPEFDCPKVTLCGWRDIKIQLLSFLVRGNKGVDWRMVSFWLANYSLEDLLINKKYALINWWFRFEDLLIN